DSLKEQIEKLKLTVSSPYFGSFTFDEEKFYIGRFGVVCSKGKEHLVIDWRAPVASLFYDYELGPAKFKTPSGWEKGEITEKLQFKIEDREIVYCFDTALNIDDEMLAKTLAESTSNNMKTIIATIQKKQNEVIRQNIRKTTVVQGVAGSGKTSIALHRIAYLLYTNRSTIDSSNILIFSPNKVFSSYISTVLPNLGEKNVKEITFDKIFEEEFIGIAKVEKRNAHIEKLLENPYLKNQELDAKNSQAYFERLNSYLSQFFVENFTPANISVRGKEFKKELIQDYLKERKTGSIYDKFRFVANGIISLLSVKRSMAEEQEKKVKLLIIHALIGQLTQKNIFNIYARFEASEGRSFERIANIKMEDALTLLYIKNYIFGPTAIQGIKHVIVDEMQDYSPVALGIINQMYPVEKTIVGDIHQSVDSKYSKGKLSGILDFAGEDYEFIELNKNYRSTFEIFDFANRIIGAEMKEAPIRRGKKPEIIKLDLARTIPKLKDLVRDLRAAGTESIAILTKTTGEAMRIQEQMKIFGSHLITGQTETFKEGLVISAAHFAKGLEFDVVIIANVDEKTFKTDLDAQSLFVAVTRALHEVYILCEGRPSELIYRTFQ
ncbi:MAG: AAA family ATPase, partial [Firmicutes bacterium]|nr:AAA family ATPase [Bacillota bacterium]